MNKPPKKNYFCFEHIYRNTPLPMLELMLPFLPASLHKTIAVLVKFLELKYTMDFFSHGNSFSSFAESIDPSNPVEMMSFLKEMVPKDQQENIDNMFQMVQAMEMMQAFQEESNEDINEDTSDTITDESSESSCEHTFDECLFNKFTTETSVTEDSKTPSDNIFPNISPIDYEQ